MPQTTMVLNTPVVKFATTQAGLAAGLAMECQINSAAFIATPTYNTVPSTGCTGPSQSAGITSWTFDVTHLQDWPAEQAMALSWFANANDGQDVWVQFIPYSDNPEFNASAEVTAHAGNFGGVFGDGSAAQADLSWPVKGQPVFTPMTVVLAADAA